MLITKLYEKKPDFVEKCLKQILGIDGTLKFKEQREYLLVFGYKSCFSKEESIIYVEDFSITGAYQGEEFDLRLQKFMTKIFGKKYINKLVQTRNETRDEWIKDFDEETRNLEYKLSVVLNLHETLGPKVKPVEEINDSDLGFY